VNFRGAGRDKQLSSSRTAARAAQIARRHTPNRGGVVVVANVWMNRCPDSMNAVFGYAAALVLLMLSLAAPVLAGPLEDAIAADDKGD
jgi:hypothetical protein